MKHLIVLLMALLIASCEEPTPQELREQAKQIEEKAAQREKAAKDEARRKALHRQTVQEAMKNCQKHCDKGDSEIFYLDGHKYRMWWSSRGHAEHIAVVHDPECEMNDIKAIIERR